MANNYVTLDGKRYLTTDLGFTDTPKKAQQIRLTLTGKTASQDFSYTDERWAVPILVRISEANAPTYGDVDDLEAAYAKEYVSFTDVFGSTTNVFVEGELPKAYKYGLIEADVHFKVALSLHKRQV